MPIDFDKYKEFVIDKYGSRKLAHWFTIWIMKYSVFLDNNINEFKERDTNRFVAYLQNQNNIDAWQIEQAKKALDMLNQFMVSPCPVMNHSGIKSNSTSDSSFSPLVLNSYSKSESQRENLSLKSALHKMRSEIRVRHYSIRTERTYEMWIRRFVKFISMKPLHKINTDDINKFLSYLAVKRQVAASTQNQALNAIVFFCKHVL